MKKKERVKDPDKIKKRDNIFTIILSICDVVAVVVLFLLYGPFNGFRDWLVTTAMSTMNHQYFATTFYSDEYINKVTNKMNNNFLTEVIPMVPDVDQKLEREIRDRAIIELVKMSISKGMELTYGDICLMIDDDPSEKEYENIKNELTPRTK